MILDNVQYDPFGPVTGWTWGNNTLAVRSFDLDGRVTLIDSAGLSVYGYHDDGTIARRNDDEPASFTVPGGSSAVSVSPTSNRITGASGTLTRSYTYDAAGNTLSSGETIHTYNHRGRMKTGRLASTSTDTEYLYNAFGQRVRKTGGPAGTVKFAYDEAGRLIGEYNGSNALIQETIWLGDIPVATLRPDGGGYQVFYVHTDHLNTPRRVSRPSDNAVLWRWASDAYGEALPDEDADGDTRAFVYNLRFPGQYFDVETALSYNYSRDLDPAVGRYVQSDPIGLDGGINTYAYVGGNPLSRIDPEGLDYWVEGADPSELGWGQHQSICVGKYGTSNRFCISFGRKPGDGQKECLFNCDGHVYRDKSPPGDVAYPRHRETTSATDRKIKRYLQSRLGEQRLWDVLGGENCRVFSQNVFDHLDKTYGGKAPAPPNPYLEPPVY